MWYKKTALVLSAVGAINWGLDALSFNVVNMILGGWPTVEMIVYYLVGLCGIYALYSVFKD